MAWTSVSDVQDSWLGEPIEIAESTVNAWIDRAERKIRREIPNIEARIEADTEPDLIDTIRDVVVEMLERKFRNPEGIRQVQETTGPMSGSITYGGDQPGQLYLTDENKQALTASADRFRAYTVSLIPVPEEKHPLFGALVNGPDGWAPGENNV